MLQAIRISIVMFIGFTLLLGMAYPAAVTGMASLLFPAQASGSLITDASGKAVGSSLIGQSFSKPEYFWGRLSATGPVPYNAAASSGSNLGNAAPALAEAVKARIAALKAADPNNRKNIPVDLVTASGSGLDPQISPAAASYQIERVARARNMKVDTVRALVEKSTQGRFLGILGEPGVNVLVLNLALDDASRMK